MVDATVQKLEKSLEDKVSYRDKMRSEASERRRRQDLSDEALLQALKVS